MISMKIRENPFIKGINDPKVGTRGASLFTVSDADGRTWSVLKLLSLYNNVKVLSHPYIVTRNNQSAKVEVGIEKILRGGSELSASGGQRVKNIPVEAKIIIDIKPRIGGDDVVNIEINIDIDEFKDETSVDPTGTEARVVRQIFTNANIRDGEILALGGLIRVDTDNKENKSPILGRIPLLGWLFKSRSGSRNKTNLTVFIKPTIIMPEFRGGIGTYTKDYIKAAKQYSKAGGLFEGLRDPITRWFFRSEAEVGDIIDEFVEQYERVVSLEELRLAKNKEMAEQKTLLASVPSEQAPYPSVAPVLAAEEEVVVVDNDALLPGAANVDDTISVASVKPEKKAPEKPITESSEDQLKSLLQGAQNPLVNYFDSVG